MLFAEGDNWFQYGAGGAALTLLSLIAAWVWKIAQRLAALDSIQSRLAALEFRTETISLFQLRRSTVEGVRNESLILDSNGKPKATYEALSWFAPLAKKLRELYKSLPPTISDRDLSERIEVAYGADIARDVCLPRGRYHGECMVVAVEVARSPE